MFELLFIMSSTEGAHTHDKTNITDDSGRHFAGVVGMELDAAGTVHLKQDCAIMLAAIGVETPIVISNKSGEQIRIIVEKSMPDSLERFK